MKISAIVLGALAAQGVSAHYFFDATISNGVASPSFQYVRGFTRAVSYNPIKFSSNPAADIRDGSHADGPDIRCNQGAFSKAGNTQVLTVNAGSEVRLRLGVNAKMEHPGPALVYMSRAPGDNVKAYDGSGDWFKIKQEGVCNSAGDFTTNAWCTWGRDWISATVPKDTPDGEYLFRVEHIGIHRSHVNQPEHYVSCAQIKVQNGGSGTPGPVVKFPGAYKDTDAYANFNIYGGHKDFPFPGPAVWSGGSSSGGSTNPPPATTNPPPATTKPPTSNPSNPPSNPPTNPPTGNCSSKWGQCGGRGWTGATCCSAGACKASNEWYSQCV